MKLSFEWMVALRHLRSRRRHAFISLITVISILGVSLGVAALITVIAVMTGFSSYMQDRILGTTSHILVQGADGILEVDEVMGKVSRTPRVTGASPYVMGQSLLKLNGKVTGVVVRGVDPPGAPGAAWPGGGGEGHRYRRKHGGRFHEGPR